MGRRRSGTTSGSHKISAAPISAKTRQATRVALDGMPVSLQHLAEHQADEPDEHRKDGRIDENRKRAETAGCSARSLGAANHATASCTAKRIRRDSMCLLP